MGYIMEDGHSTQLHYLTWAKVKFSTLPWLCVLGKYIDNDGVTCPIGQWAMYTAFAPVQHTIAKNERKYTYFKGKI